MANIPPVLLMEPPPAPPRQYGLFDVALGPMPMPRVEAQGGGVMYVPDTCEDDVFLYAINCPPVSGSKTFSLVEPAISGTPFGVVTSYVCSAQGFSFGEAEARVRTRMMLREQRAVERRVWQGTPLGGLGGMAGLFQSATTLSASGCVTEAVEQLEQALADNGIVGGIIHARPGMSAHLSQAHLIERGPGRQITTKLGTPVAFGQGYNGTGPAGQAVTTDVEYMYASGRVLIWGSELFIPPPEQTFDKPTNQMYLVGEKVYVVIVECGVWTTAVTRNCTTGSGA